MSAEEYVVLVDSDDNIVGYEEKLKAHQLGKRHRAFSIFILRENQGEYELLIHQRNIEKYHCGGLWTNTCCSHPRRDEALLDAAHRRLKEEMGMENTLEHIGSFEYIAHFDNGLTEHELDHVVLGYYEGGPIALNPEEVQAMDWVPLKTLKANIQASPETYTPWFEQALDIVLAHIS